MTNLPLSNIAPVCSRSAVVIAAVVMIAGALAMPQPAQACSCVQPIAERITIPFDGTEAFPVDGTIRVFLDGGFSELHREAMAGEYRLVDEDGQEIELDSSVVRTRLDLTPRQPLKPNRRYILERVFAYDGRGVYVSDTHRLWSAQGRSGRRHIGADVPSQDEIRRVWFPDVSFRTAAESSSRGNIDPQVTDTRVGFAFGGGDCGPGISLGAEFDLPETAAPHDVVELEVRDQGIVDTSPAVAGEPLDTPEGSEAPTTTSRLSASDMLCNPSKVRLSYPSANEPQGLNVRILLRDASGELVGTSDWSWATGSPRGHVDQLENRGGVDPGRSAVVEAWFAPPVVEAQTPKDEGGGQCPYGFRIASRQTLTDSGAPWGYNDLSMLSWIGRHGWLMSQGESSTTEVHRMRLDEIAGQVVMEPVGEPREGRLQAATSDADGAYAVTSVYSDNAPASNVLYAFDDAGKLRWQHEMDAKGAKYRITTGSDRIALTWIARRDSREHGVEYAVFDRADGDLRWRDEASDSVDASGSLAATFVGKKLLIAWPEEGGSRLRLKSFDADGDEISSESIRHLEGLGGHLDLTSTGIFAGLVMARQGRIDFSLFGADGRRLIAPTPLSTGVGAGDNRKPRIAWGGFSRASTFADTLWIQKVLRQPFRDHVDGFFAVTWEGNPSNRVYASAVDLGGTASPAVELSGGVLSSTATAVPLPTGDFLGSYTRQREEIMGSILRCRTERPPGPPQRIHFRE